MTSLQDGGRIGHARFGIARSGAMDRLALAHANALVGNAPNEAAIELMLLGLRIRLEGSPARAALTGAAMPVRLDGQPVALLASFTMHEGQTLTVGAAGSGVFAYLALAGGFDVTPMLGSRSLQARAGIGGLDGRAFRAGDRLRLRRTAAATGPELSLDPLGPDDRRMPVRVVLGPQDDHFDNAAVAAFLGATYTVSAEADRMGYRLSGPPLAHRAGFNIVSDGIVPGSVQVPGSGVPIVMMADHQTTGGYPKIATVISADLGRLAQRRPGDRVRFAAVSVADAEALARERVAWIAGLSARLRPTRGAAPTSEELLALNLAGAATDALAPER